MEKKKYYLTTPIYYPSDNFHIGHCYTTVIADTLARYKRAKGFDVFFLTGTDEHGQKIEERAKLAGTDPKSFVDKIVANAQDLWSSLGITYDKFIRTTDEYHVKAVQKMFRDLYEKGDIYKGEYEGWYCTPDESFWTDSQLVDGKCPECGREVKKVKEESYFLRLSNYQKQLEEYLESHPELMQPESRYKEMLNNFLKPGLQDLSVSRTSFKWGIPVDFDPDHVIYVWMDALSNYITALGYNSDDDSLFQKYWPAELHLVGKEIFRFHTLIWPIMLMALDLPLPKQVYGHGWLVIDGGKISKSLGNYKDPRVYINDYGVDAVRYYLLSEVPFGNDGNFSEKLLVERSNSDLANVLGNLVNRTVSMTNKYFGGTVTNTKVHETVDEDLIRTVNELNAKVEAKMDTLHVDAAIAEIFNVLKRTNRYVDETTPWVLGKDESKQDRLQTVLFNLLEAIRVCTIQLEAFIPKSAQAIFDQLQTDARTFDTVSFGSVDSYTVVEKPSILFARIDEKELEEKWAKEAAAVEETTEEVQETKPEITFDDFMKTEMKVGLIEACEKHPKADKLLVSQINIGTETRQVVSGIAPDYTPEDMIGKKVIVVTNLKPAKIRGVESQGMILVGEDANGIEVVNLKSMEPGATVR
ncbi:MULTISPECIES: methionine--tRNA ligase [unclassified Breznakia]|uniref:methionine--tRNA ligase n=1 Tax=unclassified Breznakia TaxID=2623764 RepID=UPI002475619E|nr:MULTISPECIES: methionine--tRNA ligase [unclassified Breznakia]MDH6367027.1 methionyl-tRNA synthetase [Breznakia sp. PH1-1]MDH6404201.1 methionyl-tRNA synthetase [Breznakia sp. PF1-11]MDH6411914.1 methionyl-tRNA synthetase [Breznakia sp. PFB1-11]MDH6414189.1 methionyl-tRNA synthetase [Breznakia sp. PFB1-14]MDH6415988.1 methionyl-tRNA synthetase [Breznakia sp. PFB1-4]